ncbi:MAG: DUF1553 domain-containing protein [Verrucomicrobiales bacterium]|jgi:hypothetical protein|nr:DUF1553 domain-containing protein [Verrucomicrobiales bacterium]
MKVFLTRILPRLCVLAVLLISLAMLLAHYLSSVSIVSPQVPQASEEFQNDLSAVNETFARASDLAGDAPAPAADRLTLARRLSLALTGSPPSLEEIRSLEKLPEDGDPIAFWLDHLFADRRYADYLAERFARAFVGVETGPFLVYRRRRLVTWLGDQLTANRPYDELVRDLISAEGLWTSQPETNFITVSVMQGKGGPDEQKLAARSSRAFLGFSLDCVQCHDDKFGDRWKQEDFHQLAAYFAQADMTITGVREKKGINYETRYLGKTEMTVVAPHVPYQPELLGESGSRREQIANWVTHPKNEAFARATVNRTWAILFGRPLLTPVDDIPLDGPYPAGLEELARCFTESGYDLQYLIRIIASSEPFRRDSRSGDPERPVTAEQEAVWCAFPITPLRPEQVAGSVIQASTLQTLDSTTHVFQKLRRSFETRDFVKRYGDPGENEFAEESGTIPQRLLLMNGKLVRERIQPNPLLSSTSRIAKYSPSDNAAIDAAFLAVLTRYPNEEERNHFRSSLDGKKGKTRDSAFTDLFWALINTTEFSWNR